MAEKKTNSFFKRLVGFLHFLFACVTLVGIGFMYLNSNYGRGLDWIKTETFEQSPDFSKKVQVSRSADSCRRGLLCAVSFPQGKSVVY